jgi:hypothetical protein
MMKMLNSFFAMIKKSKSRPDKNQEVNSPNPKSSDASTCIVSSAICQSFIWSFGYNLPNQAFKKQFLDIFSIYKIKLGRAKHLSSPFDYFFNFESMEWQNFNTALTTGIFSNTNYQNAEAYLYECSVVPGIEMRKSFKFFECLLGNDQHSFLVGPRSSQKSTILEYWMQLSVSEYRSISFPSSSFIRPSSI